MIKQGAHGQLCFTQPCWKKKLYKLVLLSSSIVSSSNHHLFSTISVIDLFVIRLSYVILKVNLRQGAHNKQWLLILLRANLWRQWDLLFYIHGQSCAHTETHKLTNWEDTQMQTYRNTQTSMCPDTEYS